MKVYLVFKITGENAGVYTIHKAQDKAFMNAEKLMKVLGGKWHRDDDGSLHWVNEDGEQVWIEERDVE